MDRSAGRGFYRILLLSYPAPHGQSLVCGGLSCCLGLGRDLLLLGTRQRNGCSRSPAAFVAARRTVAQRRIGGPGMQRALLRGDCGGSERVRPDISGGEIPFRTSEADGMTGWFLGSGMGAERAKNAATRVVVFLHALY